MISIVTTAALVCRPYSAGHSSDLDSRLGLGLGVGLGVGTRRRLGSAYSASGARRGQSATDSALGLGVGTRRWTRRRTRHRAWAWRRSLTRHWTLSRMTRHRNRIAHFSTRRCRRAWSSSATRNVSRRSKRTLLQQHLPPMSASTGCHSCAHAIDTTSRRVSCGILLPSSDLEEPPRCNRPWSKRRCVLSSHRPVVNSFPFIVSVVSPVKPSAHN